MIAPAPTPLSAPLVTDSVTMLGTDAHGRAVLAASHGGIYAAYLAAKAGVKAAILSDAGVGRERAGIGGLGFLEQMGVPAAAVGHRTARIGDGVDCAKRGIISHLNAPAAAAGLRVGMHASVALDLLAAGDGLSTYRDGFVTAVNETAARHGGEIGIAATELVRRLVAARGEGR